eukprot:9342980-Ditylum_brightwellii.AAC.1
MASDIMHHWGNDTQPKDVSNWQSPTATSVSSTTQQVLLTCSQYNYLPAYSYNIATLPQSKNGLGIFCPKASAALAFVVPMMRAICYSVLGVKLQHTTVQLS